jgi:arsenate reductase
MESIATLQMSALSHPQRLSLFRLLVRRYPDAVPAGEIAAALGVKANTASVYLAALVEARLIDKERRGTSLRYRADLGSARDLVQYLFSDCCRGRLELCLPAAEAAARLRVLFLCTGNSARSLCAEALLTRLHPGPVEVFSAGTDPAVAPNAEMMRVLSGRGHDTGGLRPKNTASLAAQGAADFDVVISLCDRAANEECPPFSGQPLTSHWSLPDPVRNGAVDIRACEEIYAILTRKIRRLVQIDFPALSRADAQAALDAIATLEEDPVHA